VNKEKKRMSTKRLNRRDFLKLTGLVAAGGVLASCAPKATQAPTTVAVDATKVPDVAVEATAAPVEATAAPVVAEAEKVVIWSPGDNGTVQDWATDPILKEVEKATNTKIEMLKIGWDTYLQQVNSAVASGTAPDIIGIVDHNDKTQITQWVNDGVVAAFEGAVAEAAPNVLAEYEKNPTLLEVKIDGKIYGQPVGWGDGNYPNMGLFHVRKDLLDKYGMQAPDTFDQYFEYLKAAKADGLQGVIFSAGGSGGIGAALNGFLGAYGLPLLGWVKKDGKFEFCSIQPKVKDALLLFRKMVMDDLVDPTSWEDKEGKTRDMYVAGQAASLIFNGGGHIGRIQTDMTLAGKGALEWLLPALDNGQGSRGYTTEPMFWGLSFLGGMKGNNPVAAARVMNYLISPEGYKLTTVGVEGIDYKTENGQIVMLPDRTTRGFPTESGNTGAHPLATTIVSWQPQEWQTWALLYGKDQTFVDWFNQMWDNQGKYQVQSYGLLITSPKWNDFQSTGAELVTRNFLAIARAASEQEASDTFDQFVTDWLANGGQDAQAEMSDALVKIYG
jgi:putative aldouronate transport system substrate-binding protein